MVNFRESDVLRLLGSGAKRGAHVIEGVAEQDDCGVLELPLGYDLCATTDFVRGTGFTLHKLGHLGFEDLGRYVVAANVSDLAAMGASPLAYLSVVRYGPAFPFDDLERLLRGIGEACTDFECPLIGGDSGSYHADVLSGTALGLLPSGRRLSRSTIAAGDAIYVSGMIGGAAAALAAATHDCQGVDPEAFHLALQRWRKPSPRVELGKALVALNCRVSAMDVSDGLTASLQQLSRITELGFRIDGAKLPIGAEVMSIADALEVDPLHLACGASVDFELLVASAPENEGALLDAAMRSGTVLTRIGECSKDPKSTMTSASGYTYDSLPGTPWDHQTTDIAGMFDARP